MRYVAAYLLASLGGNASPDAAAIKAILDSVGVSSDATSIDKVVSELKGKDLAEVIADGNEKLASVPGGGGGGLSAPLPMTTSCPSAPALEAQRRRSASSSSTRPPRRSTTRPTPRSSG